MRTWGWRSGWHGPRRRRLRFAKNRSCTRHWLLQPLSSPPSWRFYRSWLLVSFVNLVGLTSIALDLDDPCVIDLHWDNFSGTWKVGVVLYKCEWTELALVHCSAVAATWRNPGSRVLRSLTFSCWLLAIIFISRHKYLYYLYWLAHINIHALSRRCHPRWT